MAEKILIVDDDLDTLRLAGLMLEKQGYQIVAASNGQQALNLAKTEKPDLILLDMMMPDLDGVEVTRRLRQDEEGKDVPIIMFTAKTQVEDKLQSYEAGVDDYLTKPTQPRELLAHVKAVLSRSSKARVASPAHKSVTAPIERGYSIGILSARGGLGVSTLALNLGVSLRTQTNKEVIVADYRPGQGTLCLDLGYLHPEGFTRLLQKEVADIQARTIQNELIAHSTGVRFLFSSPQPRDAHYLGSPAHFEHISRLLPTISKYVVIDLGVSLGPIAEKVIPQLDEIILVVEPAPQTLVQSRALIEDLKSLGIGDGRITVALVNRIRSGMQLSWSQVQDQLGRPVAVIFTPAPELAFQASMSSRPMVLQQPDSLTAQQFGKLSERLAREAVGR